MNNTEKEAFILSEAAQILKANVSTPNHLPGWITGEQMTQFNTLTDEEKALIGTSSKQVQSHFLVLNKTLLYPRLIQRYKERIDHAHVQMAHHRGQDWVWWYHLYQELLTLLEERESDAGYMRIIAKVEVKIEHLKEHEYESRSNQIGLIGYINLKDNLEFIIKYPDKFQNITCYFCGSTDLDFNPTQYHCHSCDYVGIL